MDSWRRACAFAGVLVCAAGPPAAAEDVRITHDPAACVLPSVHSRLRACVRPTEGMGRPRAYFRTEGDSSWYSVEMQKDGDCHIAVLPRAEADARRLEYYVFVQSTRPPFAQAQTPVHLAEVRSGEQGCATPFETDAKVRAVPAAGEMRVPRGFSADGLQGLPKPERKMGAAGLVIGGGVAAASAVVAGAVLVKAAGSDPTPAPPTLAPTEPPTPTPGPPPVRTATPTPGPDAPTDPAPPAPTTVPPPTLPPTTVPSTLLPTLLPSTLLPTLLPSTLLPTTLLPTLLSRATLLPSGGDSEPVATRMVACRSVLDGAGARGQVVLDSVAAWFPSTDEPTWRHPATPGRHRLELLLVRGGATVWRLELLPETRLRPGTLRVVAGVPASVEDRAVVLRLAGKPGERAVVVFELD